MIEAPMSLRGWIALALVLPLALVGGAGPPGPAPADFKLKISFYGLQKEPIRTSDLIVHKGRLYSFLSDSDEVTIIDLATGKVELLDLDRMAATALTADQLDEKFDRLCRALKAATEKREKLGGRANEVAARMSRDLIEPHFQTTGGPTGSRLRLTNPTAEVDLVGTPEPDASRLETISNALTVLLKLGAIRDPEAIPPFSTLEALRTLTRDHHLRPAEITILYRLAGPPRKYRWTYGLVPTVTARETESLARIDALLGRAKAARFERYERERTQE